MLSERWSEATNFEIAEALRDRSAWLAKEPGRSGTDVMVQCLNEAADRLEVDRAKLFDGWLPVDEIVPIKGDEVLAVDEHKTVFLVRFAWFGRVYVRECHEWFDFEDNFEYWKPLPEVPTDVE